MLSTKSELPGFDSFVNPLLTVLHRTSVNLVTNMTATYHFLEFERLHFKLTLTNVNNSMYLFLLFIQISYFYVFCVFSQETLRSIDSDSSIEEFPSTINRGKRRVVSAIFTEVEPEETEHSIATASTPEKKKEPKKTKSATVVKESVQKEESQTEDDKPRSGSDAKTPNGGKNFKFGFIKQIPNSLPSSARKQVK